MPLASPSATRPAEMQMAGFRLGAQYETSTLNAVSSKQTKAMP